MREHRSCYLYEQEHSSGVAVHSTASEDNGKLFTRQQVNLAVDWQANGIFPAMGITRHHRHLHGRRRVESRVSIDGLFHLTD